MGQRDREPVAEAQPVGAGAEGVQLVSDQG
jgi:hypothetical protein